MSEPFLAPLSGPRYFRGVSHDTLVGTVVAGYSLREAVGEGGTAAVYRAEHPTHGVVAVKVLREKLRQDRTAVARFLREANFGTRVQHPNVVRTIEIGESRPGMHFLAIEWASGELLERYAKKHAPLPAATASSVVRQIADAVHAAHMVGIVHRDLKPENVMYDAATGHVKLLDFGIATNADAGADDRLTRAGFFVGTLMYVAPEALSGEIVSHAADQYSLATISYLLLSGCLPYSAKSSREMFTQLLSQPPIPLNRARPGLQFAPAVEQVVMRGLAKDPAARYPDVRLYAEALNAAIQVTPDRDRESVVTRMKDLFRGRS